MSGIAVGRLTEERKNWRKDHPPGFHARPLKKADKSTDVMVWETGNPGEAGTDWEGTQIAYRKKIKEQAIKNVPDT